MTIGDNKAEVDEMRLSKTEFYAMNNPFRKLIQKYWEFRVFKNFLKKQNIDLTGKVIIDAGCGSGYSSKLLMDEFVPLELISFDIMPEQIAIAQKKYKNINFRVGDMTQINFPENKANAVFVFGILHHIPEWRKALSNISAFLKKRGVLLVEEPRYKFTLDEFEQGISDSGLTIVDKKNIFGSYFKSYICVK